MRSRSVPSRPTQNAEWRVCGYGRQDDDRVDGVRGASGQANAGRRAASAFYNNRLASWMTSHMNASVLQCSACAIVSRVRDSRR